VFTWFADMTPLLLSEQVRRFHSLTSLATSVQLVQDLAKTDSAHQLRHDA
jgi:hypothetical protein